MRKDYRSKNSLRKSLRRICSAFLAAAIVVSAIPPSMYEVCAQDMENFGKNDEYSDTNISEPEQTEEKNQPEDSKTIESILDDGQEKEKSIENDEKKVETTTESSAIDNDAGVKSDGNNAVFEVIKGVLTTYAGDGVNVVIPENVTEIAANVFQNNTTIQSVVFPNGLLKIGDYAFEGCANLCGELNLPKSLQTIGNYAFSSCANLTGSLVLPDGVKNVGEYAFYGCSWVTKITFLGTVPPIIGDNVSADSGEGSCITNFFGNGCFKELEEIQVPEGAGAAYVSSYGQYLQGKTKIVEESKENQDTEIEKSEQIKEKDQEEGEPAEATAEKGQAPRKKAKANPQSSIAVAEDAGASEAENETSDFEITDGILTAYRGTEANVVIPENVTEIAAGVFQNNTTIQSVVFSKNILKIGVNAFYGCTGLNGTLKLPENLKNIGDFAFQDCVNLSGSLTLPEDLESIGRSAFYNCRNLSGNLELPDSVKSVGGLAFYGCSGFDGTLRLSDGMKTVERYLFSGCEKLTGILKLPESLESIGEQAFGGCENLRGNLKLPESLKSIGRNAFIGCRNLRGSLELPDSVSNVGDYAFCRCSGFEGTLRLSGGMKTLGKGVFSGCSGLTGILEIPDNIVSIDQSAFSGCQKISGIVFGAGIQNLCSPDSPFSGCTGVTEVVFRGKSVPVINDSISASSSSDASITDFFGSNSFKNLRTIYVRADCLEMYTEAWGNYIPAAVKISAESIPEALSSIVAVGDVSKIVLSWSVSHEIDTTQYYIYRRSEDEDEFTLVKKIYGRNTLSYADADVREEKKYYYYVAGVNTFGQIGFPSAITSAKPSVDTENPRIVQISPANGSIIGGKKKIYIQSQDNIAVVKTELYASFDEGLTWELLTGNGDNYCRYLFDTAGCGDGAVQIKGMAYDARGNESTGLIYRYKIDNSGPEQVTGVSYESTASYITLRWKDVSDQDLAYFRVEEKKSDGTFRKVNDISTTLGISITNLKADSAYTYRVVAYDRLGNRGTPSEEITARTKADTAAPVITSILPNADYYNQEIPVQIKASDNTSVASITIQTSENAVLWDDYKKIEFTGANRNETVSETLSLTDRKEGTLYIRGIAEDTAGNVSDSSESAPYVQYIVDRTAPETPQNVTADAETGAIELAWDMGKENDIDDYILYRSKDGDNYVKFKEKLYSVNYWDRDVEKDTPYWYQVAVRDKAGNISGRSGAVRAVLPEDTEPPEIQSYAPASGSRVGGTDNTFQIMLSDNWRLSGAFVTYRINDTAAEKQLITRTNINNYYEVLQAKLPTDSCKDGDQIHVQVQATDAQGLEVSEREIVYTVDKTAPAVKSVTAEGDKEKIAIRWEGNREDDLAGYRVYKKSGAGSYSLIGQRSAAETASYEYLDYNVTANETYSYRVEAVDKVGNTRGKETDSVWLLVDPAIKASFACEARQESNVDYQYDASSSIADLGIKSYEFDFGDGTVVKVTDAKAIHRYKNVGTYQVILKITDQAGTEASIQREVSVQEPQMLGTVRVKVVDSGLNKLVGAPVYFDIDNTADNIKYTDADGCVIFRADAGRYAVGAYQDGFLPVKRTIVVGANEETELTLTLVKEPIVTGEFEVNRMTLDEIIAAGIDVADPANQQVVNIVVHLTYGKQPVTMNVVTNGKKIYSGETVIVNTDEGRRKLTTSVVNTGSLPGVSAPGMKPEDMVVIAIMDIPVEASYLKEFFDVKLHIINHADTEFKLVNNMVTLNVPKGMSMVTTASTAFSNTVMFDSLAGQEEKTISWVLRGDTAGEYDLEADYSAVLDKFNAAVNATFKTDSPIKVYGFDAMKLIADINTSIDYGGLYFDLSLQNIGGADIYLPTLDIAGNIISVYENKKKEIIEEGDVDVSEFENHKVKLLNTQIKNSSGYRRYLGTDTAINTLSVGETYTRQYVCYGSFSSKELAYEDRVYLQKAVSDVAEELGIKVEINWTNKDLYSINSAEEKVAQMYTDPNKKSIYKYLIENENFYYYRQALEDDNFINNAGQHLYKLADCVLNFNYYDQITHTDVKKITRQYIVELLQDESFQSAVDASVDKKYLDAITNVTQNIKGCLASDQTDVLFSPLEISDLNDVLGQADNIRKLATAYREGGRDGFTDRLRILAGSVVGAAGAKVLITLCEQNNISNWISSSVKEELGTVGDAMGAVKEVCDAWNDSVEITNQTMIIAAAHEQAFALTELILKSSMIGDGVVYKEVKELQEGLKKGFQSQLKNFADEVGQNLGNYVSVLIAKKVIIKSLDKIFFSSTAYGLGISAVMTTLKLVFNLADYVFGWQQSANIYTSLRVAGLLTLALQVQTANLRYETGSEIEFLTALKYLIKMRLAGERAYINLISEFTGVDADYRGDKVLNEINNDTGGHYESLEAYYIAFKQKILDNRDALYGEQVTSAQRPDAPDVSINFEKETTNEAFNTDYEYTFDGVEWTSCDGDVIALKPGTAGKYLWIRKKETKEHLSGNIKKMFISAREPITGNITVKYKEGVYYIDGLTSKCYYQFSNEKLNTVERKDSIEIQEGKTSKIPGNDYYPYLALVAGAADSEFASRVRNVTVEKAKAVSVENEEEFGTVSGAGEYLSGEQVTVSVTVKQGYKFVGWYSEDTLISDKEEYSFYVYSDMHLKTHYKESASEGTEEEHYIEQIKQISDAVGKYETAMVKSTDKETINQWCREIDKLLSAENITNDVYDELVAAKDRAQTLISRINNAASAINTDSIKTTVAINKYNVKLENKTILQNAKSDLEKALKDNPNNYTDEEKESVNKRVKEINDALRTVENAEKVIDKIKALPDSDKITDSDAESVSAAMAAYNALESYEKGVVDAQAKAKLESSVAVINKLNKAKIKQITDKLNRFEITNVKSSAQEEISLINREIDEVLTVVGLSDEDITILNGLKLKCEDLVARISSVTDLINQLLNASGSYDEKQIKATDREALEQLTADIDLLTGAENLTDDEMNKLTAAKNKVQSLIKRIEKVEASTDTEQIRAVEGITEDSVKLEDKETLKKAKADLEKALETNQNNYTTAEKERIHGRIEEIDNALGTIESVEKVIRLINALPKAEKITVSDTDSVMEAKAAYDTLTDYAKALAGADVKSKLDVSIAALKNVEKEHNIEKAPVAAIVKVSKIRLSGISMKIAAGKRVKLKAVVSPGNASNKALIWTSSNTNVATVNSSGMVSIKKKSGGRSVTITATAQDGSGVKATYKITSMKGVVKKVSISGKKTVKAGKTLKLNGKVQATKKANKKLKWISSNTAYATVSSSGKVKAQKAGKGKKVKLTAIATDGSGKKKSVTIKIK